MPEEKKSPYQEGNFQLNRLNDLQERINSLNLNLENFNEDIQQYNYKIKFDCLNTLYSEVAPCVTPKEKKLVNKYIKAITEFLSFKNPHRLGNVFVNYKQEKQMCFYKEDFEKTKKHLFVYELLIKELLHKYFRSSLDEENKPKDY